MLFPIKKEKNFPIGLDVGSSFIKLAQLRKSEEGFELLAAGLQEIPENLHDDFDGKLQFISQNIRRLMKAHPFCGRQCILSIPASQTSLLHVKLANLPGEAMDEALAVELQDKLPFDPAEAIIRHIPVAKTSSGSEDKQEVIVVAVARAIMEAYLSMAHQANLDIVGVNIESCAIVECFARMFRRAADRNRIIMLVDMGTNSTQVVLSHGGQIKFARNLEIGSEAMDDAVAKGMKISTPQAKTMRTDMLAGKENEQAQAGDELYRMMGDPLDQMADQMTQCLRYYESVFRNQRVERAIFVGGGAYDKHLCQLLAKRLNLPAQIGDPLVRVKGIGGAGLEFGLDRRDPQPNFSVAVGLSLGTELN